jgi:hypothetical protein
MVSSISSSQLLAQQAALKALQGSDTGSTTSTGSATATAASSATSSLLSALDGSSSTDSTSSYSSLADLFSSSSDDDSDDDASIFSALITQVKQQIAALQGTSGSDGTSGTASAADGSTDDVSSNAFMSTLKQKIEALQKSPDTKDMGDSMMKALDNGTLTVTDAASGQEITAWDPDNSDAATSSATSIDQTDWSTYLKEHLARDSDGRYSRNADDSQVDKVSGDSSYFGMINDNYYYLSWTGASGDASTAATTTSSTET